VSHLTPSNELDRFSELLANKIGPQRYSVWFDGQTRFNVRNDSLEVQVPDEFVGEWIGSNYGRKIEEAASEVFGALMPVKVQVTPQLFVGITGKKKPPASTTPQAAMPPAPKAADARPSAEVLPHKIQHSLESYIVGSCNELAVTTVKRVCDFPGAEYDPLFVHGGCASGKTHLLQGLCRQFARQHPTKRWLYLTGEDFTNDYITAVRTQRVDSFRRRMRDLDLLVIDDIHFLAGKKQTQEEFLHTFNAIEATGRQVVLSSDIHPRQFSDFSESLINRFISGMVVRLDQPNLSMRSELLRSMAGDRKLMMPPEAIEWIARRITSNARELEGSLIRVEAICRLERAQPTLAVVSQILSDLDRQHVAPTRPEHISTAVCQYFSIDAKDLASGKRQRTISLARSLAMFLIRKNSRLSYPEIAGKLGKRNHSTVISACRRIERAVKNNEKLEWESSIGPRVDETQELIQRLEESARAMTV
jgi:chromosomal replication initiator protein